MMVERQQAACVERDLKIITVNPALSKCYFSLVSQLSPAGARTTPMAIQQAIEKTKEFAAENRINWR